MIRLNADDYGMADGVDRAVSDAYKSGLLNSTSVVTNTASESSLANLKNLNRNGLNVSLHLNLVYGKILNKKLSSFWRRESFPTIVEWITKKIPIDAELINEEFELQLSVLSKMEIPVRYVDYHTFAAIPHKKIWSKYVNFANKHNFRRRSKRASIIFSNYAKFMMNESMNAIFSKAIFSPVRSIQNTLLLIDGIDDDRVNFDLSFFNNGEKIPQIIEKALKHFNNSSIEIVTHMSHPDYKLPEEFDYKKGMVREYFGMMDDRTKDILSSLKRNEEYFIN